MYDAKFTPGPWRYWETVCGYRVAASCWVADVVYPENLVNAEGNARLIAAAPELYEALKSCLAELESLNKSIGWRDGEWNQVTIARAAIAKARGENNG